MKNICFLGILLPLALTGNALARSEYSMLTQREQIEQRCDTEAMHRLKADKVIAYTFAEPIYGDHSIKAPGAVFRRNERWFRLNYSCSLDSENRTVTAFDLTTGKEIHKRDWDRYYLYP